MNSIGVDFKLKYVEKDGKNIRMQIVNFLFLLYFKILVGYSRAGEI